MKALVISDSHGASHTLRELMTSMEKEGLPDALIHCGDGVLDVLPYRDVCRLFLPVRGNCDLSCPPDIPPQRLINLGGQALMITHGHAQKVKWGLSSLLYLALERQARVCCFGHTHRQLAQWEQGILLLNPGALCQGEYALLSIEGTGEIQPELRKL